MTPAQHLQAALDALGVRVQELLADTSLSLTQKDPLMLRYVQQKKVIQQALDDVMYLESKEVAISQQCGMHRYRTEEDQ